MFHPSRTATLLGRLISSIRPRGQFTFFIFPRLVLLAVAGLLLLEVAQAQPRPKVTLEVISTAPGKVRIELESPIAVDVWSFTNVYGGMVGLGERVENVSARSADSRRVQVRRIAPGEFKSLEKVTGVTYEVRIAEPMRSADRSHVSWLNNREGLLMMGDLLPLHVSQLGIGRVSLKVPDGWTISSNARREVDSFITANLSESVFLIGRSLENTTTKIESSKWLLVSSGEWPISQSDVAKAVKSIVEEYTKVTGFKLRKDSALLLLPIRGAGAEAWSAEARGNSIVLLVGTHAERRQLLARLKVILTHELFHLWVPNSLALSGDYDWFFEGFTLYQSLRTTQRLGLVDFPEYLRTLGRVYDSYLIAADRDRLSLIELSERRWTSSKSLVYDRSMLVAFLYDLQLRLMSGGRANSTDVYRQLFALYRADLPEAHSGDANEVIIRILTGHEGMQTFSENFIQKAGALDLQTLLAPYGIEVERIDFKSQLRVTVGLDDSQRRLLRSLGYKG